MKLIFPLCLMIILLSSFTYVNKDRIVIPAVLKSAIVYRSGAELHHMAKASLEKGNNDVVIEGVSNDVDLNSLQFGSDGGVTVMSVEFVTNYLKPAVKPTLVKKLEDSVEIVTRALSRLQVILKTDKDMLDLLNANKEIRGTQTGLSVAELVKMMEYYKTKTLELQNEITDYNERSVKLEELMAKLNDQLNEEKNKNTKTTGNLILQLFSPMSGSFNFTISYITKNASWNPYYDLFVESVNKPVRLIYRAKVAQSTGIDWQQVKLSLSTSTPNQQNTAPVFNGWFLGYINPKVQIRGFSSMTNSLSGNLALNEVVVSGYGSKSMYKREETEAEAAPVYIVNGNMMNKADFERIAPQSIADMNVLKDAAATAIYGSRAANGAIVVRLKDNMSDYISVADNELNMVYNIDLPYDMESNGKEQSVQLKESSVASVYKFYAAPKLDKEAYLLADIADWEQLNLIPGEANIIFEGTYVGKTMIDPNSTKDTLTLTLGRDKRVVVKRDKLVDVSSVKFLGSNKKQVFSYEITVKNNKKEKISMLLKDQYPLSTNKDIEVEVLETSGADVNQDLGILNWNIELAPGESKKYKLSYSVKYPKDKMVNVN
ncbi:DUF4139 domain-containing protein [Chitinophaga sancti]|uniref:Mucoidy inhibitor MuiA family protein n=1 Tax=Chitinophaga sancti TaxID=1004 RepID=A0A1K1SY33_9BACT|nr:DUF4139 domain-containing protein [Chitinophaga sancti]WQD63137.1 mucoidy inhibitor MuiA family protein [Chitinophaga sancti]WQG91238.1 mucoidy inhibitor MuiA family protein [Chitinophaga sancti]SFW88765.1 conserved hypothetical protein [Chitinophaga sancti]